MMWYAKLQLAQLLVAVSDVNDSFSSPLSLSVIASRSGMDDPSSLPSKSESGGTVIIVWSESGGTEPELAAPSPPLASSKTARAAKQLLLLCAQLPQLTLILFPFF